MELQHSRPNARKPSVITYASLGRKHPVEVWTEEVEIHRWDVQGMRHTGEPFPDLSSAGMFYWSAHNPDCCTDTRSDIGFQLRTDEGVLLRFRVDAPKEYAPTAQPTAQGW